MQSSELPLFSSEPAPTVYPLQREPVPTYFDPSLNKTLTNALNSIFPTQTEETKVTKTRKVLGETAKTLSDEQIETTITQFQFLIDSWLDEYEREVFKGLTLREVINEK